MKRLTTLLKLLLFVVLFLLPFGGRWIWYYRGGYKTPKIESIDQAQINMYAEKYTSYVDQPQMSKGRIVIDLTHDNNLLVDDLTPLKTRLAVRGVEVEIYDSSSVDALVTRLRGAIALLELVPTIPFDAEECQVIVDFVKDGGRLLLAADPTRPVPALGGSDSVDLYSILFPESAIPAVNSLANVFGVSYFDDYVYNLAEYDANYRNVKFHTFSSDSSLTQGLNQVTLFAAHTLRGEGLPLITGDENTYSNVRAGETGFTPAMLSSNGRVLTLGDITFMTSPYYQVSDNDHFLSNIADWLATDERQWDLKDFPYLFHDRVDLIQTFSKAVDPRLIVLSTPLQELFAQSGITLELQTKADPKHDALYIGTYADLEKVQDFLTAANITITFSSTQTTTGVTETQVLTNSGDISSVDEEKTPKDRIDVKGMGLFLARGSSLYVVNRNGDQLSMIVLAEDEEAVLSALGRLLEANFDGCISQQDVTVCSTGEVPIPEAPVQGGSKEPSNAVTGGGAPAALPKVLILSVDVGLNGKRNSSAEMEKALSGAYTVTTWSIKNKGTPSTTDLDGFDAYILDMGDYAYDDEVDKVFKSLSSLENVLIIGEQPFAVDGVNFKAAPISDLVVVAADHPIAFKFTEGETIQLSESESRNPALVLQTDVFTNTDTSTSVFERGSGSEEPGAVAVYAYDGGAGYRYVIATFSFYRLPTDIQFTFINNVVEWLVTK